MSETDPHADGRSAPDSTTTQPLAELRITAGVEVGFAVWHGAIMLAALSSPAELASWIERRLGSGGAEPPAETGAEPFPRVVGQPVGEARRRRFFG